MWLIQSESPKLEQSPVDQPDNDEYTANVFHPDKFIIRSRAHNKASDIECKQKQS